MIDFENDRFTEDEDLAKSVSPAMQAELDKLDAEIDALVKGGGEEADDELEPAQDSAPDVSNEPRKTDGEWTSGAGGAPALPESPSPTVARHDQRQGKHHGSASTQKSRPGDVMPEELRSRIKIDEESVSDKVEKIFLEHVQSQKSSPTITPKVKARIAAIHSFFDREDVQKGLNGEIHHVIADLPYHASGVAMSWLQDNATEMVRGAVVGACVAASVAVIGVGIPEAVIGACVGYGVEKVMDALGLDGEHAVMALEKIAAVSVAVYHERQLEHQGVLDPQPVVSLLRSYLQKSYKLKAKAPNANQEPARKQPIDIYKALLGPLADDPVKVTGDFIPSELRDSSGEWSASSARAKLIPTIVWGGKAHRAPPGGEQTHKAIFAAMPDADRASMMKASQNEKDEALRFLTPDGKTMDRAAARRYAEANDLLDTRFTNPGQQRELIAEHLKGAFPGAHDVFDPQEKRGQPGNAGEWSAEGWAAGSPKAKAQTQRGRAYAEGLADRFDKARAEGEEFVSPAVVPLDFAGAFKELTSPRQKVLMQASANVDKQLSINSQSVGVIGAWADGAENSVMTMTRGASLQQLEVSAAMKGALADQKAVLVFHENPGAKGWLYSFPATGRIEDIHKALLEDGLAFHTLVPTQGGAKVYIADTDGTLDAAVEKGARRYGSEVEARNGDAAFLGTSKEDGSDREQRDDAQRAYAGIISGSKVQGAAAVWPRIRAAYQQTFNALRPALEEGAAVA